MRSHFSSGAGERYFDYHHCAADTLELSIADGQTITARYIDEDDGQGGADLLRTATAVIDSRAKEFPPSQKPGSFGMNLQRGAPGGG